MILVLPDGENYVVCSPPRRINLFKAFEMMQRGEKVTRREFKKEKKVIFLEKGILFSQKVGEERAPYEFSREDEKADDWIPVEEMEG